MSLKQSNVAIVGSSKIAPSNSNAYSIIYEIMDNHRPKMIISGGAKGVDSMVEFLADSFNIPKTIHKPITETWEHYKIRNILIAKDCDILYNIVIKDVDEFCYHHNRYGHFRSGGCWTENYAKMLGKKVECFEVS